MSENKKTETERAARRAEMNMKYGAVGTDKWVPGDLSFNHQDPKFRMGARFLEHNGVIFNHVMKGLNPEPLRFVINYGWTFNVRETPIFEEANEIIRNRLDLARRGLMPDIPIIMNDLLKTLLVERIDSGYFDAVKCKKQGFQGLWETDVDEQVNDGLKKGYDTEWGRDTDGYHFYVTWRKRTDETKPPANRRVDLAGKMEL
jgi:hypothetical protein